MVTITFTTPADQIETAWQRIKNARPEYNLAETGDEAAEKKHWDIVDASERIIQQTEGNSARSAEIKLWVHMLHSADTGADEADALAENLADLLERETGFDWSVRLLLSAIRDLRMVQA